MKSAQAAAELERLEAQTSAVIKSTGGAANVTAEHISELSDSLEGLTSIEQEVITEGANLLLTFTKIRNEVGEGNDIFDQAVKVANDMSVALGQDMKSSAIQLGKALNDPVRGMTALRRVGVSFTKDQENVVKALVESGQTMEAQKLILAELNTEFGGSGEALGKTLPGRIAIAKDAIGDLGRKFIENTGLLHHFKVGLGNFAEALNRISSSAAFEDFAKRFGHAVHAAAEAIADFPQRFGINLAPVISFASGNLELPPDFKDKLTESIKNAIGQVNFAGLAERLTGLILGVLRVVPWEQATALLTDGFIRMLTALDVANLVSNLLPLVNQILSGFIEGVFRYAKENPLDFVLLLVTLGFTPSKIVTALGNVLRPIPIVGPILAWILEAIAAVGRVLVAPIKALFGKTGKSIIDGIVNGIKSAPGAVISALKSVLAGVNLAAGAAEFVSYLATERGLADSTVADYRRTLDRYLEWLPGLREMASVRSADVHSALANLKGRSASHIAKFVAVVRQFHRLALREGWAQDDPTTGLESPRRPASLPKPLRIDQATAIIEAATDTTPIGLRDRAVLELLYAAGLRASEAAGLNIADVDGDERTVRCLGKGQKERIVPFGKPAARALTEYVGKSRPALVVSAPTPALFLNAYGRRMSREWTWHIVKKYARLARIEEDVWPHRLRHSAATHMIGQGRRSDMRAVQEFLGHARLSTTQTYTKVTPERLRWVIDNCHPRGH